MSLTDRENAVKGALEGRKAILLDTLAKIEEELAQYVEAVVEKVKPPAKTPPAKKVDPPAEKASGQKT